MDGRSCPSVRGLWTRESTLPADPLSSSSLRARSRFRATFWQEREAPLLGPEGPLLSVEHPGPASVPVWEVEETLGVERDRVAPAEGPDRRTERWLPTSTAARRARK